MQGNHFSGSEVESNPIIDELHVTVKKYLHVAALLEIFSIVQFLLEGDSKDCLEVLEDENYITVTEEKE